jgi:hypothetical protein
MRYIRLAYMCLSIGMWKARALISKTWHIRGVVCVWTCACARVCKCVLMCARAKVAGGQWGRRGDARETPPSPTAILEKDTALVKDTAVTHLARYEEDGYYCDARHGDAFETGGVRV